MNETKYLLPQKSSLHKIKVSDINIELPDLKNIEESKAVAIAKWLMNWIDNDKTIKPNYFFRQSLSWHIYSV